MPTIEQGCYRDNPAGILVCDMCGEPISPDQSGIISWVEDTQSTVSSFRLTHKKKRCDRDAQQPLSSQLDYVNELGFAYVTDAVARSHWPGAALTRLVLITWAVLELNRLHDGSAADGQCARPG
jgi:hypothetical protein